MKSLKHEIQGGYIYLFFQTTKALRKSFVLSLFEIKLKSNLH